MRKDRNVAIFGRLTAAPSNLCKLRIVNFVNDELKSVAREWSLDVLAMM